MHHLISGSVGSLPQAECHWTITFFNLQDTLHWIDFSPLVVYVLAGLDSFGPFNSIFGASLLPLRLRSVGYFSPQLRPVREELRGELELLRDC